MHKSQIRRWWWIVPVLLLLVTAGYSVVCNYTPDTAPENAGAYAIRKLSDKPMLRVKGLQNHFFWQLDDAEQMEIDHPEHASKRMLRGLRKKSGYLVDYIPPGLRQEVREQQFARLFKQQILRQYLLPFWYHILFRFTPF